MTRLFFKKLNDSVAQCSRSGLISSVFLVYFTDFFTAYLNFLVKPSFFLENEMNHCLKEAFYYGQWDKLFLPWITLVGSIILFFLVFKYFKNEKFFNFALMSTIILFIGAALTNVCGIIFNSGQQGRIVFLLAETLFLVLLAPTIVEQIEQSPGRANKEFLKRIRSLVDSYDF
ncbi:MAG: hypothetical protein E4H47_02245 [Parcubacteria group bacterium]|nr:MAG: hypothetical protein E4H47_02245 [Parcubacteria group bacterium]